MALSRKTKHENSFDSGMPLKRQRKGGGYAMDGIILFIETGSAGVFFDQETGFSS